jgi:hypothetical protein
MKNKMLIPLPVLQLMLLPILMLPFLGNAQDTPSRGASHHGVMVTRQVKQFGDLENQLIAATNAKDTETMGQLMADNYVLRVGTNPGDPTNRAEAMQQAISGVTISSRIEQLAVLDEEHLAVVSFVWNLDLPENDPRAGKLFVVDTWKEIGGKWKIVARYASAVGGANTLVPGYVPHALAPNKKI